MNNEVFAMTTPSARLGERRPRVRFRAGNADRVRERLHASGDAAARLHDRLSGVDPRRPTTGG